MHPIFFHHCRRSADVGANRPMTLDTSAILAVLLDEPERAALVGRIQSGQGNPDVLARLPRSTPRFARPA